LNTHAVPVAPVATLAFRRLQAAACALSLLAVLGPAARAEEVFAKAPSPAGGVNASSWVPPDGSDSDMYSWDDFTLPVTQTITEVRWRGGYALGAQFGKATDFRVSFFASNVTGFEPKIVAIPENESQEQALINVHTNNNAGETPVGVFGGVAMYDYRFVLPVPFVAQAGVKYWFRVVCGQPIYPDWGMATSNPAGSHFRYNTGSTMFHNYSHDLAFSLHARWANLAGAISGTAGLPALGGTGTLASGSSDTIALTAAKASSAVTLVFGVSKLNAPFKGGTLVPAPYVFVSLTSNASGSVSLPFTMPAGVPPGTNLYFQAWVADPAAVQGLAASNGLAGTTP